MSSFPIYPSLLANLDAIPSQSEVNVSKRILGRSLLLALSMAFSSACMSSNRDGATLKDADELGKGAVDHSGLLIRGSDDGFSGYYLDIEQAMTTLHMDRLSVHEVQNVLRDRLEEKAGSYSTLVQRPFVRETLAEAIDAVRAGRRESGFKPIDFAPGDFVVIFDWDETLMGQWYKKGGQGRGTLQVATPDIVPEFVDRKTGKSLPQARILQSPGTIAIRPGSMALLQQLAAMPGFRGYVFFTAKEDKAAYEAYAKWQAAEPAAFEHLVGFFTRNHLRYDPSLKKASKDLRIFDPRLEHAFIIDDNEARIMQKNLCYRIPKFNPDSYYAAVDGELDVTVASGIKAANEQMLPYVGEVMGRCTAEANGGSPIPCFEASLGLVNPTDEAELHLYVEHLKTQVAEAASVADEAKLKELQAFEPGFFPAQITPTDDPFPLYDGFKVVDGPALIP